MVVLCEGNGEWRWVEDLLGDEGSEVDKGGVSGGGGGEGGWEVGRDGRGGMGKQRASGGLEGAEGGGSISRRSNRSFSVDSKAFPKFKSRFRLDLS